MMKSVRKMSLEELQLAVMTELLREIKSLHGLMSFGVASMQALERLAREFWVRPRKRSKAKVKISGRK